MIPGAGGSQIYTTPIQHRFIKWRFLVIQAPEDQRARIPGAGVSQTHTTPIQHRFTKWRFLAIRAAESLDPGSRRPTNSQNTHSQNRWALTNPHNTDSTPIHKMAISCHSGPRAPEGQDPRSWGLTKASQKLRPPKFNTSFNKT